MPAKTLLGFSQSVVEATFSAAFSRCFVKRLRLTRIVIATTINTITNIDRIITFTVNSETIVV